MRFVTNKRYTTIRYGTCISYNYHKIRTNSYGVTWCVNCGKLLLNLI